VRPKQANTSPHRRARPHRGAHPVSRYPNRSASLHLVTGPDRRRSRRRLRAYRVVTLVAVIAIYIVALAFTIPQGRLAVALVIIGGYLLAVVASAWLSHLER
jgi:hypothetical protein